MLDIDESTARSVTEARLRYLVPATQLRISDLRDSLGGYACHVVEVDDHAIWIDLPIRRDGMLHLAMGQLVTIRFDRPGDAAYRFDTAVTAVRSDDHAPFGLAVPLHIDRRPHRADTRVALVLDATFERVDGEPVDSEGRIVDVSAGGLGLICAEELAEDSELVVHCDLPGPNGPIALEEPVVIRSVTMYGRTPAGVTLHHYGMTFVSTDEVLRERILSAVIWNLTENPQVL